MTNIQIKKIFLSGILGALALLIFFISPKALSQPHFKKVVYLVFENADYQSALSQADFQALAQLGALFTNFKAETHPSQGNYISMIAGSTLGVSDDQNVNLNATHLGDLLEKAGKTWRVYAEGFPGNCFLGASSGDYARKHVPFLSFTNVSKDAKRCAFIENESRFLQDYQSDHLADFSLYIPNLKNDGHDTGVDFAGRWLSKNFATLLKESSQGKNDVLFILTFDEGGYFSNNQIYTVLIGGQIPAGLRNSQNLNHNALLKLIESEMSLESLGRGDKTSPDIQGLWKANPTL